MKNIEKLLDIMTALRDPDTGCPWDSQQTFQSIVPYTIEEAYEVAEAAELDDSAALKDELGDLLLQVVFLARIAEEDGLFDFDDVAGAICDKLTRRHPHVFGDTTYANDAERRRAWEDHKAAERGDAGALADVATTLPALTRAVKLQKRAARVGFDWENPEDIFAKIHEEIDEFKTEVEAQSPTAKMEDELGDVYFAIANIARHLKLNPERAVRSTNRKFTRRFEYIEAELTRQNRHPEHATRKAMETLWEQAKKDE